MKIVLSVKVCFFINITTLKTYGHYCLAKELSPDIRVAYCPSVPACVRGCLVRHAKWLCLQLVCCLTCNITRDVTIQLAHCLGIVN